MTGRVYFTANGEKVYDKGVQHVRGTVKGASAPVVVKLRVADIREGLLSVPEIVDKGMNYEMVMQVLPGPFGRQGAR
eukprot:1395555-Amphidinium_carterae.1